VLCLADDSEIGDDTSLYEAYILLLSKLASISPENMEKIMWKNTARLWNTDPKTCVKKKQKQTTEAR
jgi:hypothetical protein